MSPAKIGVLISRRLGVCVDNNHHTRLLNRFFSELTYTQVPWKKGKPVHSQVPDHLRSLIQHDLDPKKSLLKK